MIIKDLPQIGDPILRMKSAVVKKEELKSAKIKKTIRDLIDTMRSKDLVGIAAPQFGKLFRIIAIELRQTKYRKLPEEPLTVMINPKIIWKSKKMLTEYEGCGSVLDGNLFGPVKRHQSIMIEYCDNNWNKRKIKAKNNKSIIIQHEIDHLDGILFSDLITDNTKILDFKSYLKMRTAQYKAMGKKI